MRNRQDVSVKKMTARTRFSLILGCLIVVALLVSYVSGVRIRPLVSGTKAPDFTLTSTQNESVKLSSYRGKPVILSFWATWCKPCIKELPALQALWETYNKNDVIVLAVDQGESEKTVATFLASHPEIDFPILLDRTRKTNRLYRVFGLPVSYFIDAEGNIEYKKEGFRQIDGLSPAESLIEVYSNRSWWYEVQ